MKTILKKGHLFNEKTSGTNVKEIALMQQKIDRMEEILRRLYFYATSKESKPMIPLTDMADIDRYTAELLEFIKEHLKNEEK